MTDYLEPNLLFNIPVGFIISGTLFVSSTVRINNHNQTVFDTFVKKKTNKEGLNSASGSVF